VMPAENDGVGMRRSLSLSDISASVRHAAKEGWPFDEEPRSSLSVPGSPCRSRSDPHTQCCEGKVYSSAVLNAVVDCCRGTDPVSSNESSSCLELCRGPPEVIESVCGSGLGVAESREKRCCLICFEEDISDGVGTPCCGGQFCRSCIEHYVCLKATEGCLLIRCPKCSVVWEKSSVLVYLPPKLYKKYTVLLEESKDSNLRSCPSCGTLCRRRHGIFGKGKNKIECGRCGLKFCFKHGTAHQNTTCAKYLRAHGEEEKMSRRWKKSHSRSCPKCNIPIEKTDNTCNHMVCSKCGKEFCWLCKRTYNSSTSEDMFGHYSVFNLRGCPGLQFTQTTRRRLWARRIALAAGYPLMALVGMPAWAARKALQTMRYRQVQRRLGR